MLTHMSLRKFSYHCAGLIPVLMSIFAFPVILLARHNKLIGQLYYWIIFAVSEYMCLSGADHHVREQLFKQLREDVDEEKRAGKDFKVLEIGPGTGGNFAFYPSQLSLTTLELNPLLEKHTARIKCQYPGIKIENSIIGNAEDMSCLPDQSFDAVVGTHIMCCIKKPQAAVREIHRVLKPGGKFYMLEYVLYPEDESHKRRMQQMYAPFWRFFGMGCKAGSQDCTACLQAAGFNVQSILQYRHPDLLVTHSLTEYGTAIKEVSDDGSQLCLTQNPESTVRTCDTRITNPDEVIAIAGA